MVTMKTIALWQFLLLTKFKICTVLPRNIMAVYEEDDLHCYRSTSEYLVRNPVQAALRSNKRHLYVEVKQNLDVIDLWQ